MKCNYCATFLNREEEKKMNKVDRHYDNGEQEIICANCYEEVYGEMPEDYSQEQ